MRFTITYGMHNHINDDPLASYRGDATASAHESRDHAVRRRS
jgi:hypothetical protein